MPIVSHYLPVALVAHLAGSECLPLHIPILGKYCLKLSCVLRDSIKTHAMQAHNDMHKKLHVTARSLGEREDLIV